MHGDAQLRGGVPRVAGLHNEDRYVDRIKKLFKVMKKGCNLLTKPKGYFRERGSNKAGKEGGRAWLARVKVLDEIALPVFYIILASVPDGV